MKLFQATFLIIAAVGVIVLSQSLFVVDETEQAIVLQLGQPTGEIRGSGLHYKIPLVQDVRYFDARILSVDPRPEQMVISSSLASPLLRNSAAIPAADDVVITEEEADAQDIPALPPATPEEDPPLQAGMRADGRMVSGEPIVVDSFARYRIVDPLKFLKTLRTEIAAQQRLENILNDATRTVLGRTTLRELLSEGRTQVMAEIRERMNRKTEQDDLGIEIIDVRIVRADLTPELRQSTVRRMISELQERATETRAKGEERALEIRSTAEKERTVILAEAERDAQILRGEGDKDAILVYASAFNKDKDFYAFIRSLEAYRKTMADADTQLILSPDSDFFRYFTNMR